jgi:uncharacterized protein (DUF1330 family)
VTTPLYLVVSIWIHDGCEAGFEAYEGKAARIMARYGGAIERAVRVAGGNTPELPLEVHVVTFPNEERLAAYRADAELRALAPERESVIAKTVIVTGVSARHM